MAKRLPLLVGVTGATTTTAGVGVSVYGWIYNQDALILGSTVTVIGLMTIASTIGGCLIAGRYAPTDDVWETAQEIGYRRGWFEGHRSARPVVVPILKDGAPIRRRHVDA